MKPIRLAVIGGGHLGRIHARLAAQLEHADLVAVVDPDEKARNDAAEQSGAAPIADMHEILDEIDAAIVATPTITHHAIGKALLERGIHVLIEKPIATAPEEADDLIETAARHGAVLQVGHVERFNPAFARVQNQISDPKYIVASRTSAYPFRSIEVGVVHDLMIHDLDVALALVNSPVRQVEAMGMSVLGGKEDVATARLVFDNGCVASLTASRVSYQTERTMQVWTPTGFTSIDFAMRNTTVVRPNDEVAEGRFDPASLSPQQTNHLKRNFFDQLLIKEAIDGAEGNPLLDEQRDLVESIRSGRAPRVTGEQGREALAVSRWILEKIAVHAWDGVPEGRIGPHAEQPSSTPSILRGPHWDLAATRRNRREAG